MKTILLNIEKSNVYQYDRETAAKELNLPEDRFLWFRIEENSNLLEDEIIFGPETVTIKWSK